MAKFSSKQHLASIALIGLMAFILSGVGLAQDRPVYSEHQKIESLKFLAENSDTEAVRTQAKNLLDLYLEQLGPPHLKSIFAGSSRKNIDRLSALKKIREREEIVSEGGAEVEPDAMFLLETTKVSRLDLCQDVQNRLSEKPASEASEMDILALAICRVEKQKGLDLGHRSSVPLEERRLPGSPGPPVKRSPTGPLFGSTPKESTSKDSPFSKTLERLPTDQDFKTVRFQCLNDRGLCLKSGEGWLPCDVALAACWVLGN